MEHDLELIRPILEIVDCTIHLQSYPGNIGSCDPYISPILEILDCTIHTQSYPGNSGNQDVSSAMAQI